MWTRIITMKSMKRNRLRQLVSWEYITQSQANQLWRDYLRIFKTCRLIGELTTKHEKRSKNENNQNQINATNNVTTSMAE